MVVEVVGVLVDVVEVVVDVVVVVVVGNVEEVVLEDKVEVDVRQEGV